MRLRLSTIALIAAVLAACADLTTQPSRRGSGLSADLATGDTTALTLLYCPRTTSVVASAAIGPEGGKLEAGAFDLEIPPGALPDTEVVTLTRPAGDYLEADARVGDYESYTFLKPVSFTVSYGLCPPLADAVLSPVWIDPTSKAVLQKLTGASDPWAYKIKFKTDHFSGYAVAY
jgi:hypothetical protein